MKIYLLAALIMTASNATMATPDTTRAPLTMDTHLVRTSVSAAMAIGINCGFICDSFGRCRRVCW
ncbi:MAG TPA: hypothetical protein VHQ87_17235 [Rhizobacter sp.]|jgi:formate/nitrite transporter FocA (FNT family)|nr:hypothetical protein [Rhizobacter sp.]